MLIPELIILVKLVLLLFTTHPLEKVSNVLVKTAQESHAKKDGIEGERSKGSTPDCSLMCSMIQP
jgi:hypothetical protein